MAVRPNSAVRVGGLVEGLRQRNTLRPQPERLSRPLGARSSRPDLTHQCPIVLSNSRFRASTTLDDSHESARPVTPLSMELSSDCGQHDRPNSDGWVVGDAGDPRESDADHQEATGGLSRPLRVSGHAGKNLCEDICQLR